MVSNLYDEALLEAIETLNSVSGGDVRITYQACETIWSKSIYGRKLVETLPDHALTSKRLLSVDTDLQVPELLDAIDKAYEELGIIEVIREFAIKTRVYGACVLYVGSNSDNTENKLSCEEIERGIFFNVLSPINFAGTKTDLNPISRYFLKPANNQIIINPTEGYSKSVAATNGERALLFKHTSAIPYTYTLASMGFWGRSIWANMGTTFVVLSNLMHTFDRYSKFAAAIHYAEDKGAVSQASNGANGGVWTKAVKRVWDTLLSAGIVHTSTKGSVKAVGVNGAVELTQLWESLTKLLEMGAYDTPVSLLLSQTFQNGLSEGKEDVKTAEAAIQTYLNKLREVFNFIDQYIIEMVWTDDFLNRLKKAHKKEKPAWNQDVSLIRHRLKCSFRYSFTPVFKDSQKDRAIAEGHRVDSVGKMVQLVKENSNETEGLTNSFVEDKIINDIGKQ